MRGKRKASASISLSHAPRGIPGLICCNGKYANNPYLDLENKFISWDTAEEIDFSSYLLYPLPKAKIWVTLSEKLASETRDWGGRDNEDLADKILLALDQGKHKIQAQVSGIEGLRLIKKDTNSGHENPLFEVLDEESIISIDLREINDDKEYIVTLEPSTCGLKAINKINLKDIERYCFTTDYILQPLPREARLREYSSEVMLEITPPLLEEIEDVLEDELFAVKPDLEKRLGKKILVHLDKSRWTNCREVMLTSGKMVRAVEENALVTVEHDKIGYFCVSAKSLNLKPVNWARETGNWRQNSPDESPVFDSSVLSRPRRRLSSLAR